MKQVDDINYALVEEVRPPFYKAIKFWGKKPHNIWRTYIERYTPGNGFYLDPFAGSAMSAFEAVKTGRKAIAFDLNPLTSFIIEVFCSEFRKEDFRKSVDEIESIFSSDNVYKKYFSTNCRKCGYDKALVQHCKWDSGNIYELGIICLKCNKRYLAKPNQQDIRKANESRKLKPEGWYPDIPFHKSPSFTASFIRNIGGNKFSNIWTERNLHVLSRIFNFILLNKDETIKKQLLFGFIKTLHLCTKMNVPRRENANRAFSTSWGRSAYICAARQMEMNPLPLFLRNCLGKQSVEGALVSIKNYLGKTPKILYIDKSNKSNRSKNFDIKYGIVDINTITDFIDEESIDFIMTDPPYGGLVQYFDLSSLWLVWLQKYNQKFWPDFENEITIKNGIQDIKMYQLRFQNGIKNLFKLLKPDGKIVFTFHNKNIKIWNAFLVAISFSGFKIEKVIHQQNKRTGESNVANPYGTSANDFYIRCIKAPSADLKTSEGEFEHFITTKAIQLIAQRNEPTPFQILFNGLLAEISIAGFNVENFDKNIESILSKNIGKIFITKDNNKNKAGNYWWFVKPEDYIKYPDKLLSDRIEETIISLLRRKVAVTIDEVIAEIFIRYPNGLTPDIRSIDKILKKYANKSGGKWVYKGGEIEEEFTKHSEIIYLLSLIGKKLGFKIFIGKREQSENYNSKPLSFYADLTDLNFITDLEKRTRIEMIDMLWIKNDNIEHALEVENSTNFTSGIQRASNLGIRTEKLMIIPDNRIKEFKSIKDPLFIENFKSYNWRYIRFSQVEILKSAKVINKKDIEVNSTNL
jgi:SAM-dependent methyltransferase